MCLVQMVHPDRYAPTLLNPRLRSAMRVLNVLEASIPSLEGDNFVRMALLEKRHGFYYYYL